MIPCTPIQQPQANAAVLQSGRRFFGTLYAMRYATSSARSSPTTRSGARATLTASAASALKRRRARTPTRPVADADADADSDRPPRAAPRRVRRRRPGSPRAQTCSRPRRTAKI